MSQKLNPGIAAHFTPISSISVPYFYAFTFSVQVLAKSRANAVGVEKETHQSKPRSRYPGRGIASVAKSQGTCCSLVLASIFSTYCISLHFSEQKLLYLQIAISIGEHRRWNLELSLSCPHRQDRRT